MYCNNKHFALAERRLWPSENLLVHNYTTIRFFKNRTYYSPKPPLQRGKLKIERKGVYLYAWMLLLERTDH